MRSHVKAAGWRPWEGTVLEKIGCHKEDRDLEKMGPGLCLGACGFTGPDVMNTIPSEKHRQKDL